MNVPDKNEVLMEIVNALADNLPANPTDEQIAAVLAPYMSRAAIDSALGLYHQYLDCADAGTEMTSCFTADDIISFLEAYYEKDLPKLRAVVDGISAWINDPTNTLMLASLGNAYGIIQGIIADMQASAANMAELAAALDTAGVKPELFELYINLEPYFSQ